MSPVRFRSLACWAMIAVFPFSLWAADSGAAMLQANGTAWINGSSVPRTHAVFPGDLVQTRSDSVASITASGSNVVVLADSLVKFEGPSVSLQHGSVAVATSKGLSTQVGEVTVTPASNGWTEFEVKDSGGKVQIVAKKGDVSVSDGSGTSTTLAQGQQTTVSDSQENKKRKRRAGGAVPAGGGGVLDSPYVIYGGAAAVGGLLTWVLVQGDEPISPKVP